MTGVAFTDGVAADAPSVRELALEACAAMATVHYDHMGTTHADVERCLKAAKALYAAVNPAGVKGNGNV